MTTLRDIAEHFGLSESTVSRILNGKGRVAPETRQRVLAYAEQVAYHPNLLAKSLKSRRSDTVGVVLPDLTNEYYAVLFKHIEDRLREHRLMAILLNTNETAAREAESLSYLQSAQVDALIVATSGSQIYATLSDDLLARMVFVDNRPQTAGRALAYIGSDNVASSRLLTDHLLDRGYDRIATLVGGRVESSAKERLAGFREALERRAVALPDEWVVETNFLYADGVAKADALLSRDDRPNAVIAQNNVLAYATIRVAQRLGLRVPHDLAVCCFDHVDVYGFMRPRITTVVQPIAAIAGAAADAVRERQTATVPTPLELLYPAEFRVGDTS